LVFGEGKESSPSDIGKTNDLPKVKVEYKVQLITLGILVLGGHASERNKTLRKFTVGGGNLCRGRGILRRRLGKDQGIQGKCVREERGTTFTEVNVRGRNLSAQCHGMARGGEKSEL